ncbi:ABC transporter permease [Planotetraspora kaengkrachanensis]|uniref:ABC transporter permease n=1 Tax=Planotetraspora kaengkrachanensis TaxID=575193 RepID=A0A8J3VAI6_9ACTN|nr:ABC transporter permease [Planotetraspora kaengkrachanensis]GIG82844.1 ABC transporter permease [Planotetraspora kaengkrachanensis]
MSRAGRSLRPARERRPVLTVLAVAAYLIMLGPALFVVAVAFTSGSTITFPPEGFSLRWFGAAASYRPFLDGLGTSALVATAATVIALAVGIPATLAVHRGRLPGRAVVQNLFLSPIVLPELVLGLALYQQLMVGLGVTASGVLLIGHTILLLPYAVRVTGASLALADPALEEAARGLGAGPVTTFFRVTLPVLRPGIAAAAVLGFVTSFNNVPLSLLLQGPGTETLPVAMLQYVQTSYDPVVAAVSVVLLLAAVVVAVVAERLVGFNKIFGGIGS